MFDISTYLNKNKEVKLTYGKNYKMAFLHFINFGMYERRPSSIVFDISTYYNSDLKYVYRNGYKKLIIHFLNCGINEGRRASTQFDVKYYLKVNTDLKKIFNNNYKEAYLHYINSGINEGRKGISSQPEIEAPKYNIDTKTVVQKLLDAINKRRKASGYKELKLVDKVTNSITKTTLNGTCIVGEIQSDNSVVTVPNADYDYEAMVNCLQAILKDTDISELDEIVITFKEDQPVYYYEQLYAYTAKLEIEIGKSIVEDEKESEEDTENPVEDDKPTIDKWITTELETLNEYRTKNGVAEVEISTDLNAIADTVAKDVFDLNMKEADEYGVDYVLRIINLSDDIADWERTVNEDIAEDPSFAEFTDADDNLALLLSTEYTKVGFGTYTGEYDGIEETYNTLVFQK